MKRVRGALGWGTLLVASVVFSAQACSLILDVEPDCTTVSSCAPYICNPENTACLSDCLNDSECAPGFVCQRGGSACISQGCSPATGVTSLFTVTGTSLEYDAALLGSSIWLIVATADGIGLAQVNLNGEVVGGAGGFTLLDGDPAEPAEPVAISTGDGITFFWRGTPGQNLTDLRMYRLELSGPPSGPRVVYTGRRGQGIDAPTVTRVGNQLAVAWATFQEGTRIQILPLNLDGTFGPDSLEEAPNEAAVLATESDSGASLPALGATAGRGALARRATQGGSSTVVSSFLDSEFSTIGDHTLSTAPSTNIDNLRAAGMSGSVAVAWIETNSIGRTLLRAVDAESGALMLATASQDYTTPGSGVDLAAGSTEFALVWIGEVDGESGLFMRRFDESGQPLFVTFGLTTGDVGDASLPNAVRTDDGYAVFWSVPQAGSPQLFYRRYVCAR